MTTRYTEADLLHLFKVYNLKCSSEKKNAYVVPHGKAKFHVLLLGGMSGYNLYLSEDFFPASLSSEPLSPAWNPTFGIGAQMVLPRRLKEWSINVQCFYQKARHQNTIEDSYNDSYQNDLSFDYFKLHSSLQYQFRTQPFQPFLFVGHSYGRLLKYAAKQDISYFGVYSTRDPLAAYLVNRKYETGFHLGVGIAYKSLGSQIKFESNQSMVFFGSRRKIWSILLQYRF